MWHRMVGDGAVVDHHIAVVDIHIALGHGRDNPMMADVDPVRVAEVVQDPSVADHVAERKQCSKEKEVTVVSSFDPPDRISLLHCYW
jgi:hypothetical protein